MSKAQNLTVYTLGQLKITYGTKEWQKFRSDKSRGLLLYLVLADAEQFERKYLATLFWPDASPQASRTNLRGTLLDLRRQWEKLSGLSADSLFTITRQTIQINREVVACDVFDLQAALAANDSGKPAQLLQLTGSLSADFLPGFGLPDADPFEEWLAVQRTRYNHLVLEALEQAVAIHRQNHAPDRAAATARRLLEFDNLDENAWQQLVVSLGEAGNVQAVERAFAECQQVLRDELGVTPSAETVSAYENAKTNAKTAPAPTPKPLPKPQRKAGNLEAARTTFFGRIDEIEKLRTDLTDPDIRLMTLLGVGGTGKSSLSKEVGRQLQSKFPDGVWFVSFAGSQTNDVLTTVGDVLDINFHGGSNRLEQLIQAFETSQMLLIFDNFEDVIDEALLVSDLLGGTQHLKVLCTSRQALDVGEEWVVQLDGLNLPPKNAVDVGDFSSVQLFVQRARQTNHRFELTSENAQAVAEICRFVDGSPLGIELAAAWMRKQSAESLLNTMRDMPDMLRTKRRDVPAVSAVCVPFSTTLSQS